MKHDIPRGEWPRFFESFTMQHDGWLVRVESATAGIDEAPLEGIVARDGEIVIITGRDVGNHRRIVVSDPLRVSVESEAGVDQGVEIESSGGMTRLWFL